MNKKNFHKLSVFLLFVFMIYINNLQLSRADSNYVPSFEVLYVKEYRNDPALVLHLPLLEGKGSMAYDISGLNNHGTLNQKETIIWLNDGGLHLNGIDESIIVNASMSLQSAQKTVIVQFMWDGKGKDSELYIYDDGWAYNGGMIIYIHPTTSRLYIEFKTTTGTQKNLWHDIIANKVYTVIFRFDGLNYYLWLNDAKEKTGSLEELGELGVNHNVGIGSNYIKTHRWFSGNIFTVQVFNRSISATKMSSLFMSLQETSRADPGSKYVIGSWIVPNNDIPPISGFKSVQAYLNQTHSTSQDEYGIYLFVFYLPREIGNYSYTVTVDNMTKGEMYASVVVDQIVVSELGSTSVGIGEEAIAWFKLKSKFDDQPMESGSVTLTGGLNATWNVNKSSWEYREIRGKESSLTLYVESVIWNKYEITTLYPNTNLNVTTIRWQQQPWYNILVTWLLGVSHSTYGVIMILFILTVFIRFGVLKVEIDKSPESERMRRQVDNLLKSLKDQDRGFTLLNQFLCKLLLILRRRTLLSFHALGGILRAHLKGYLL